MTHRLTICWSTALPPVEQQPTPSTKVPELTEKREFNPNDVGFSLLSDEETLLEIETINDETVRAAQETLKFAWR